MMSEEREAQYEAYRQYRRERGRAYYWRHHDDYPRTPVVRRTPEEKKAYRKAWAASHRDLIHMYIHKNQAKRREMGFIPLNLAFPGCCAHHVDMEYIIHIPAKMHHSISHNVWTGRGMGEINVLAFEYLETHE